MNTRQPCVFDATHPPGPARQEPFDEFERAAVVPMQFARQCRASSSSSGSSGGRWFVANRRCSWMAGNPARPLPREHYHSRFVAPEWRMAPRVIQIRHKGGQQWGEGGVLGCQLYVPIVRYRRSATAARPVAQMTNADPVRTPLSDRWYTKLLMALLALVFLPCWPRRPSRDSSSTHCETSAN